METFDITWETPRASRPKSESKQQPKKSMKKYEPFVEALKERPGDWAVFKRSSSPTFSTRLKEAYPGIETTCRNVDSADGKQRFDIYARWTGQ
jgi:hypothetical protein